MSMEDIDVSEMVKSIADAEKSLAKRMDDLKTKHPKVFAELDAISEAQKEVDALKATLKSYLESRHDYDVYEAGGVRASVSKIVKIGVEDINRVPNEYKKTETVVVADEKKVMEEYKVFGTLPDGFVDKSYSRLNWKVKGGLNYV